MWQFGQNCMHLCENIARGTVEPKLNQAIESETRIISAPKTNTNSSSSIPWWRPPQPCAFCPPQSHWQPTPMSDTNTPCSSCTNLPIPLVTSSPTTIRSEWRTHRLGPWESWVRSKWQISGMDKRRPENTVISILQQNFKANLINFLFTLLALQVRVISPPSRTGELMLWVTKNNFKLLCKHK